MSEQTNFTEENKKTVMSFVSGLIVGGLLVYMFALPGADETKKAEVNGDADVEEVENNEVEDEVSEATSSVTIKNDVSSTPASSSVIKREGIISVEEQEAGDLVTLSAVTFPADAGWIGVRDYENGQLTGLLGVSRFDSNEGLLPESIKLIRGTEAGKTYAVVFYHDNGDKEFNLANDAQMDSAIETFLVK